MCYIKNERIDITKINIMENLHKLYNQALTEIIDLESSINEILKCDEMNAASLEEILCDISNIKDNIESYIE